MPQVNLSSDSPAQETTHADHDVIVLPAPVSGHAERRKRHLEKRAQIEPKVYATHYASWIRALLDPGTLAKAGLWLMGMRAWTTRNALALRHRPLTFAFDDLPGAFHRLRLLHLTDLHIDVHPDLADRVIEQIRDVEVDLCVLTGDYRLGMAGGPHDAYRHTKRIIRHIRSRGGIVGILGNHDAAEDVPVLEDMGIRILLNEAVEIRKGDDRIWLAGVDDTHDYRCHDISEALQPVPAGAFTILLSHTPELYQDAAAAGFRLYLCGHTHGGQLRLPGFGPLISKARCPRRYTHDVWRHGRMFGYTSNGIGTSGAFARMCCPPEVGLIELRKTGPERRNGR